MFLNYLLLWTMLIGPWLTLFFLGIDTIKRYMPLLIFTMLITTITYEIAYRYKWWVHHIEIVPWGEITNPAYAYGAFPVLTLWIFYFTYRNFWLFMATNALFNVVQWYFIQEWVFEARRIVTFVNITNLEVVLIGIMQALILYGYQRWQETIFTDSSKAGGGAKRADADLDFGLRRFFRIKAK